MRPAPPTNQQQWDALLLHLLMERQTSGIADCLRHICSRDGWEGYAEHLMTEMGDLLVINRRLSDVLGFDFHEIAELGQARDHEKSAAWLARHPGERWL